MRKILAIALCVCAVLSVMAVVAAANQAAVDQAEPVATTYPPPDSTTTTAGPTTTKKPLGDQINDFWESIKPWFEPLYKFSFQGLSQALVLAFQWLLRIVGIGTWTLPWA